jgi:hypothetical protein
METRYIDAAGHEHATCACGHDCSTHPDAGNPLDCCADCGCATCPDCREYHHTAPVCTACCRRRTENAHD